MSETALETAKRSYDTILAGDFDGMRALMHEDCVIEFYGPNTIPYAGIYKGRETCMKFFDHVRDDVVIHEFSQNEFIAGEKQVAVVGHLKLQANSTGHIYDTEYVHIIDIEDGKWRRFRDFADTATVAHAFLETQTPTVSP
jgi:ketosteroid isomerase-like protein